MATIETTQAPSEAEFRQGLRAWLEENAPRRRTAAEIEADDGHGGGQVLDMRRSGDEVQATEMASVEKAKDFQRGLYEAGYAGLTVPREYGGRGLEKRYQEIFVEESARFDLPLQIFGIGLGMCMPTLLEWGTEEQKRQYIPPLLRADVVWCQLFSEPGAGSDVASLSTRAVRDGEEWVVNGQKVWTSGAHYSDYGMLIARTNVEQPKHRGISMFVLDMRTDGVTIRPLKQINGEAHFNEVFFDDVRIPAENLVGPQDGGWRSAIAMLMNERVSIGASGGGGRAGTSIDPLVRKAREAGRLEDPVVRDRLADIHAHMTVQRYLGMRIRDSLKAGKAPGPIGSIAKLHGAQIARAVTDLGIELAGPAGQAWDEDDPRGAKWALGVVGAPGGRIAGGTDEIQRNIIGERMLGLPKEPQVDRDQPFRELRVGTQRS